MPGRQPPRRPSRPGAANFSYYASRSEEDVNTGRQIEREPKPVVKRRQATWRRRGARLGLAIVVLAVLVKVLSLSSQATVMPLAGGSSLLLHTPAEYQAAADQLLSSSIWNHNKITVDTAGFSRQLTTEFPELSSVSLTLPLLSNRPTVYLQTVQPALILATDNGSFVITTAGEAVLASSRLAPAAAAKLPLVTDQSGLEVSLNHQALTVSDVGFIQTVVAQLNAKAVTVATMTLPASTNELDVHLSGAPYFVKFNLQNNDARQQVGTFLATRAYLQKQNVTPSQYIDVRLDGRAYYK